MARFIALYLPQYHQIPENDMWWGVGYTEWEIVAQARSLFRGHVQPHIPADLGFYNLEMPEIREKQAQLAQDAGIESFCYYHYWFGNGKQLLEKPFNAVVNSGKPDFPFCLCWANHSWYKKHWNHNSPGKDIMLIEQKYLGAKDYEEHFYALLPAFKDKRYTKVNGKLFFIIYKTDGFDDIRNFMLIWRNLAEKNGLNGFYFVTTDADSRNKDKLISMGFDAIYNADILNIHHKLSIIPKCLLYIRRKYFHRPTVFSYKKAMKYMINHDCKSRNVIPTIAPNWDHSPRSGGKGMILKKSNPILFQQIAEYAIDIVNEKPKDEQIVIVKSWNEWGEGNYMEPDREFGHGYINALRKAIEVKQPK